MYKVTNNVKADGNVNFFFSYNDALLKLNAALKMESSNKFIFNAKEKMCRSYVR